MIFKTKSQLDNIAIAAPCSSAWEDMRGDDKIRFCSACELNVYNISEMSRNEAEKFLQNSGAPACLRLYRRADGTLITKDCPVGQRIADGIKRPFRAIATVLTAILNANMTLAQIPASNHPVDPSHSTSGNNRGATARWGTAINLYTPEAPAQKSKTVKSKIETYAMDLMIKPKTLQSKADATIHYGVPINNHSSEYSRDVFGDGRKTDWRSEANTSSKLADNNALEAFWQARKLEEAGDKPGAVVQYQLALEDFRRTNGVQHDPAFKSHVANAFRTLLQSMGNEACAKSLEEEFSLTP